MIKRKVKPRKRKNNPSPYRQKSFDDYNYVNIEKSRFIYQKGYVTGLINGLKNIHLSDWKISKDGFKLYVYGDQNYYKEGYYKGLNDSQEQLKLIPKNKLKQYIKELEEEIDGL